MHVLWRGDLLQRGRLVSGLVLFAFAATHFLNHAAGLVSVDLMQSLQDARQVVTRSLPGTIVLATSLLAHAGLALVKVATRTTLRMAPWEMTQLALGLAIPLLLLPHIVNTRIAHTLYGVKDIYLYELLKLWPESALSQSLLLVVVWLHGCMGLHYWLRLTGPYQRLKPILLALAIAVPLAALSGFMVAGRAVHAVAQDPEVLTSIKAMANWPNDADAEKLYWLRFLVRAEYLGVLFVVIISLLWTWVARRSAPQVTVCYAGGPTVRVPEGGTLLEVSRQARVAHASVCGGRARCSTCRVRIDQGGSAIAPPTFAEGVTLGSIKAPPNVRLACQLRPKGYVSVTRLLPAGGVAVVVPEAVDDEATATGVERDLAVMFVDLRGFTRLAHNRMPFDTVFILNQFFAAVGAAIVDNGGRIDKFLGDGLLAVFGQNDRVAVGCRQALGAARAIDLALDDINGRLAPEIGADLSIGIGIDAGQLLLGRIGFGAAIDNTVIGPAVNIASRLEAMTKEHGLQIMISDAVVRLAGWEPVADFTGEISVRGVDRPVGVRGLRRARDLPAALRD